MNALAVAITGPADLRDIDSLRLHPDSERVPMATADDLATLRASLAENGQQDPIDVTPDGLILDGRTRWTLLQALGAKSIKVRVVDVPERDQTHYIVDRALARRHLTADQKRALNGLLRTAVVEVAQDPKTGEEMRIGQTVAQRAETLGVKPVTVRRWDEDEAPVSKDRGAAPTHVRHSDGKVQPIRYPVRRAPGTGSVRDVRAGRVQASPRIAPSTKRTGPPWRRHFTLWCRSVLPEDRKHLMQMSDELHKALGRLDLACGKQEEVA